jgi:hypothetical protein
MGPLRPRLPALLLVALLLTWGTCPCVFARMLGLGTPEQRTAAARGAAPNPC